MHSDNLPETLSIEINLDSSGDLPEQEDRDASFDIWISEDKMQARLSLHKARGQGRPLDLKELGAAIRESGVHILDRDVLRQDIYNFVESALQDLVDYPLAEGRPARTGGNQVVDWALCFYGEKDFTETRNLILQNREILAGLDSYTSFPLDELGDIADVEEGDRVLTLGQLPVGEAGFDVYGKRLDGIPGKEFEYLSYEGLELRDRGLFATVDGILERALVGETFHLRARPHKDAEFRLEISKDTMEARLGLSRPEGTGKRLNINDLYLLLENERITQGIIPEAIKALEDILLKEESCENLLIAQGQPPKEGGIEKLQLLVEMASGKAVTIRSDGKADFKNRDQITRVLKDQTLARVLPPLDHAEPGWDLRGKELRPANTRPQLVDIGQNLRVEQEEEGIRVLIAECDGELLLNKNRIEVLSVHTVKGNVGMGTGNLKFPGSIHITGDVESGFAVISEAEVKIAGGVESALISSVGDLLIRGGVKGGRKALLRSRQNLMANYVEQATVLAMGNVKIGKACMRSVLKCNGRLELPDKGAVIGGTTKVRMGMVVGNLGSPRGIPTHIHFGQDYLVEDQINVEEKEIKKGQAQISAIDKALQNAQASGASDEVQNLYMQKIRLMKLLEKRSLRLFMLKALFEQHFNSEIRVHGSVYPGVRLESHGRSLEIHEAKSNLTFVFDTAAGRIVEKQAEAR